MVNYKMEYGVSEVATILKVDKISIKDMAYYFSDYLNPRANPEKGCERVFTVDDLCTLNYISMYWEEKPDFENIKYGLNSESQFETPFSEIAEVVTPIFREFSEEFIGGNAWMIGGLAEIGDQLNLADSYKLAGDVLINQGIENENIDLIYPTIYTYRHATELYLKSIILNSNNSLPKDGKIHSLERLFTEFNLILKNKFNVEPPKWFENLILAFNDFDPNGTMFRYGLKLNKDEIFINPYHIKKMMEWFSESIHNIKNEMSKLK